MIYTCYEMIADCRAGRAEGWRFFVSSYVPVIRKLLERYRPAEPARSAIDRVLVAVHRPESALFQLLDPAPERWFVAQLRQKVLEQLAVSYTHLDCIPPAPRTPTSSLGRWSIRTRWDLSLIHIYRRHPGGAAW